MKRLLYSTSQFCLQTGRELAIETGTFVLVQSYPELNRRLGVDRRPDGLLIVAD
jgi:hypothetical protein